MESIALRGHLLGPRSAMGLKSRKNSLKEHLPILVGKDSKERIAIPPKDCPSVLLLPYLPDPPLMTAVSGLPAPDQYDFPPFIRWFNYQPELLRETYGVDHFAPLALDVRTFTRMLGKIGHAFAVAKFGADAFLPLLIAKLRDPDRHSRDILPFVGGRHHRLQPALFTLSTRTGFRTAASNSWWPKSASSPSSERRRISWWLASHQGCPQTFPYCPRRPRHCTTSIE
jgi:hypothetical protein